MATLFEREIPADLAANHVRSINRSVTADVDKAVVHDAPDIVASRWEDCWKNKTEFDESFRDHRSSLWAGVPVRRMGRLSRTTRKRLSVHEGVGSD